MAFGYKLRFMLLITVVIPFLLPLAIEIKDTIFLLPSSSVCVGMFSDAVASNKQTKKVILKTNGDVMLKKKIDQKKKKSENVFIISL